MIKKVVTHRRPHLDEIVALWLLRKFGEKTFPGVSRAIIEYIDAGDKFKNGSPDYQEKQGILLIGVGGGRFDEHPKAGQARRTDVCTATLVADAIGVANDPGLKDLLSYVLRNDTIAFGHSYDIASCVKAFHETFPNHYHRVLDWVFAALEMRYKEDSRFIQARTDFSTNAKVEEIQGHRGRMKLAVIQSDSTKLNKVAIKEQHVGVMIQRNSSGNVQIFGNKKMDVRLKNVAHLLNMNELALEGDMRSDRRWEELSAEGSIPGGKWHLDSRFPALFNGSFTAPNVPPTKIPLERIAEIVKLALDVRNKTSPAQPNQKPSKEERRPFNPVIPPPETKEEVKNPEEEKVSVTTSQ